MGRILFVAGLLLSSIATLAQQSTPIKPQSNQKQSATSGAPHNPPPQTANVLPPHPPVSLVILHNKSYQFSPALFEGSALDGRMQLTAVIKNNSQSQVTVSNYGEAVIHVISIDFKGLNFSTTRRLVPVTTIMDFDEDPRVIASQNLVPLPPGATVQFPIRFIRKLDLILQREVTAFIYTPPGCGTYTLTFQYFYVGPDGNFQNVYHFGVTSDPIKVNVISDKCR